MIKDETGNKYGRLTVLHRAEDHITPSGRKYVYWHCKCNCGNEKDISANSLRIGATQSCGCLQKEKAGQHNQQDLTNKRFGKLVALEPTSQRQFGYIVWKCLCDCGNIHYVTTNNLNMKQVSSCGQCNMHNSKGEERIKQILEENHILFEREKTFENCYYSVNNAKCRFDFWINNQYLIEFDGKQHFIQDTGFGSDLRNIQKRDQFKNNYCKQNKIPLIRIPYTHYENLCLEDLLLETSKFLVK
jgi:hypothetical protein